MKNKTILISGGAGFIGANFINFFAESFPQAQIVNLDKLTYAAAPENINLQQNYQLVEGDISEKETVDKLFEKYEFDGVFHFAAESHVDNSITGPEAFVKTNIQGTFNLVHACYLQWMEGPHKAKSDKEHCRFHHISTDEVYGSLGKTGKFTEETAYAPNSPYSATKAGSDFLVRSYFHTFGMNVVTTNCSNNYGPFQHDEKLIPVVIRKALSGEAIPIYGDGKNVRDWLFVKDHCEGIEKVFLEGRTGETYNIGGNDERENIELCQLICSELDRVKPREDGNSYSQQIQFVEDRPGHDKRYAVDTGKIGDELGWQPKVKFEQGIQETIQWYLKKYT